MSNPETPPETNNMALQQRLRDRFGKLQYDLGGINPGKEATDIIDGMSDLLWEAAAALETLHRRVEELKAREQWQPIETAPKDGGCLLLYGELAVMFAGEINHWIDGCWRGYYCNVLGWRETGTINRIKPTHWRPIPESPHTPSSVQPTEQAEGGEE
jgi:hypothetical protein